MTQRPTNATQRLSEPTARAGVLCRHSLTPVGLLPIVTALCLSTLFSIGLFTTSIFAQETRPSATGTTDEGAAKIVVEESPLETVFLRREDGTLVPFFDIPFEVFEAIYRQYQEGQGDVLPEAFTIERTSVQGAVVANDETDIATLSLTFRIVAHRDGWIQVPLGLGNGTLTGWHKGAETDETWVSLSGDGDYVAWINGTEDQAYEVRLDLKSKVSRQGNQRLLRLSLPTATLSQFELELPTSDPEVTLSSDKLLPRVETLPGGKTRLSVSGVTGDFELRWRDQAANRASGLSVVTDISIQIDGPDLVRYQVALDVASLNGQDRSFLIRLPAGARFDAAEQLDLEVAELEPDDPRLASLDPQSRYVQVTFPQPLDKPTRVVLYASRSGVAVDETGMSEPLQLGGFEVLDAVRQSGTLLLSSSRDWRVDWTTGRFVRQVSLEAADRERPGAVARFQFSRSPIDLASRIVRIESRIVCEPVYDLLIQEDQIQLDATLKYAISGPRPDSLIIDSRGWEMSESTLADDPLIARIRSDETTPGRYRLDLDPSVNEQGFKLPLRLVRPYTQLGDVEIPLPLPLVSTLSPAVVGLRASENLEVTPQISGRMATLRNVEAPVGSPADTNRFELRIQSLEVMEFLACQVTERPQKKTVQSRVHGRLLDDRWLVEQRIAYDVRYRPLTSGFISVSREMLERGQLQLRLDDQPLMYQVMTETRPVSESERVVVRFDAPRPLLGSFTVEATYQQTWNPPSGEEDVQSFDLDLVIPVEALDGLALPLPMGIFPWVAGQAVFPLGDLAQEVSLDIPDTLLLASQEDRWRLESRTDANNRTALKLMKLDRDQIDVVRLGFSDRQQDEAAVAMTVRGWVQSTLTPQFRRDRVSLGLVTSRSRIEVEIPAFAQLTAAAVDGKQIVNAEALLIGQRLTINLDQGVSGDSHTIELWYRFANDRQYQRWVDCELPRIDQATWIEQLYWEIVLPPDEYLLWGPRQLVSENVPLWRGLWLTDQAALDSSELEEWLGVPEQPGPSDRQQRYVYSGFGPSLEARVWIARRWEIVLGACGLAFGYGMLLVYIPVLRRGVALLLASCVGLALALCIEPGGLILSQLVLLASLFVLLGAYLRGLWNRPAQRFVTRAVPVPERASTSKARGAGDDGSEARSASATEVPSRPSAHEVAT